MGTIHKNKVKLINIAAGLELLSVQTITGKILKLLRFIFLVAICVYFGCGFAD